MSRLTALGGLLQVEDVALFVWLLIGPPLLGLIAGPTDDPFFPTSPIFGLIYLAGLIGAIACLVTRPIDAPRPSPGDETGGRIAVPGVMGPMVGGLLFIGGGATAALTGNPGPGAAIGGLAGMFGFMIPGPWVTSTVRRALITPYVFAASTAFDGWIATLGGAFGLVGGHGQGLETDILTIGLSLGLTALVTITFYAMLVFAPRQIAQREGSASAWVVRYVVFVVALTFGAGWLRVVTG